ncbi:hypothetical protein G4G28_14255 [Massilia sp. Dwa41.01b]|uniref:hypothetical protein n=1 Tax=unclassified Massilia TaxID=2609279 RepID=UPI0016036FA5|nr:MULTISPECIES: hypothetical protein [unclassified Massilia]QNA89344.1 hypothetical protein G4G28_14255 [Massilia sp. Dwa41.01b]QNB00239.1 hypothetical protein G4G31_17830 [Massilia sp. Se16.2.3]
MSILSSLGLTPKAAVIDDLPPPSMSQLLKHVIGGSYQEAEQLLLSASDEERERLLHTFSQRDDAVELAQQWVQSRSGSSIAHTLLGASMIGKAWKIRGSAYGKNVDPAAVQPFFDLINGAPQPLLEAARLDAVAADPFAWLILAEVRRSGDRDLIDQYFAQATARVPMHWPTHYRYFMVTTEKWGGSHERMFRFAQESAERAPRGSAIHFLVALAYCEHALALGANAVKQLRNASHAARVSTALYAWLNATPATLEEKLHQPRHGFRAVGLNHFAVACYLCGAGKEARALVAALERSIMPVPWAWIADGKRESIHPGFVHDRVQRELARA